MVQDRDGDRGGGAAQDDGERVGAGDEQDVLEGEGEPEAGDNPEKDSVPFIGYIVAASEVMGYNFGFDELDAAIDAAMDKHNALYKIRFGWRLIKAFAAKGKKA